MAVPPVSLDDFALATVASRPDEAGKPPPQSSTTSGTTSDAVVRRAQRAGVRAAPTSESKIKRDGLEAGTLAPNFVVRDLKGDVHSLTDYRGRRVLLVFSDVTCGPCEALAPELVRLAGEHEDVQVVMISRGDPQVNRQKAERYGYPFPVLLQRSWEISKQYGMFATPIGYLIDEEGVITKDVAVGNDAILALAD